MISGMTSLERRIHTRAPIAHALALDVAAVVQRRAADGRAGQLHRLDVGQRA